MQARRIAIAFGIAIIFPLLIYYGVATFHPAPKFQSVVTAIPVGSPNTTPNATPKQKKDYDEQRQKLDQAFDLGSGGGFGHRLGLAASSPLPVLTGRG